MLVQWKTAPVRIVGSALDHHTVTQGYTASAEEGAVGCLGVRFTRGSHRGCSLPPRHGEAQRRGAQTQFAEQNPGLRTARHQDGAHMHSVYRVGILGSSETHPPLRYCCALCALVASCLACPPHSCGRRCESLPVQLGTVSVLDPPCKIRHICTYVCTRASYTEWWITWQPRDDVAVNPFRTGPKGLPETVSPTTPDVAKAAKLIYSASH